MQQLSLEDDQRCFVCGMENPDGLRLHWVIDGLTTTAQFIPDHKYQGWKGIVHGGIIATLLDEAMTRLACVIYGGAVTAEMTVRFVAPAQIGQVLSIRGEILSQRQSIIEMKATIHAAETLVARSSGKAIKI